MLMGKKELFVLRHAKSSWDEADKHDIDRALKTRGINDAHEVSKRAADRLKDIDLVLCSPANRAMHTAMIFAETLNIPLEKVQFNRNIYEADESTIDHMVKQLPDSVDKVMIVGHNPAFTYFVNNYLPNPIYNLPTTGLVGFKFECKRWSDISKKNLKSSFHEFPGREE